MPQINLSNLNTILTILGLYTIVYAFLSVKIKQAWYLGEALPAVVIGIALGQVGSRWIDPRDWGMESFDGETLQDEITSGMCRVVIGVQLVIAGYQLPAKYSWQRLKALSICLLGLMSIMWMCTSACMYAAVPKITFLAAMVIGSCVTCTDPILSQAIAKGPFADKYVRRPLREIISCEAGANDGFAFPYLMLAVYLMRHAANPNFIGEAEFDHHASSNVARDLLVARAGGDHDVGRLGGGAAVAMREWFVETWIYYIILSVVYGATCGLLSMFATNFALRKKWVESEMLLLWPTALGLFLVGTCGLIGSNDLLACFVAGNLLNWNGQFLEETEVRHDEVNASIDVLLNFGGFMYIGAILPWSQFSSIETGLTYGRLVGLGFMVLVFRRIPAVFIFYKAMPEVCGDWKEALFMGYFGPIGIGAVFYVEHAKHLFPTAAEATTQEERDLASLIVPVVYWLVLFSIIVHGLSIPLLNIFLKWRGVEPIKDGEGFEMEMLSRHQSLPKNAARSASVGRRQSVVVHNRFSRTSLVDPNDLPGPSSERRWPRNSLFGDEESVSRSRSLVRQLSRATATTDDVRSPSPAMRQREIKFMDDEVEPKRKMSAMYPS